MPSSAEPALRRSCQFCRSRKIRCSGDPICTTCRLRSIDCVYGREGSKGRSRASSSAITIDPDQPRTACTEVYVRTTIRSRKDPGEAGGTEFILIWSIGHELESIFQSKFSGLPALADVIAGRACSNLPPTNNPANTDKNIYNNFIFTYPDIDSPALNFSSDLVVGYEDLFASIYYGLVELISTLFGSLGCTSPRRSSTRYLEMRLFTDQTRDMFDSCPQPFSSSMPMSNADDENYVRQMI
jgi:hypothetical protein